MPRKSVLLIDDDAKLGDLLKAYLAGFEIDLTAATDPELGIGRVRAQEPDLVLLDVMMPGKDGFQVCREIRGFSTVPILMLTARGETADRIVGLEMGADDYLPKPFEPRELAARIQSILRRAAIRPKPVLSFGPLEIRAAEREASLKGQALGLSSTEFELLFFLASQPGRKFHRDEIMNHLRGFEADVFSRSIDVLISRLRAKIEEDPKSPRYLKTVWGVGYVFAGGDE